MKKILFLLVFCFVGSAHALTTEYQATAVPRAEFENYKGDVSGAINSTYSVISATAAAMTVTVFMDIAKHVGMRSKRIVWKVNVRAATVIVSTTLTPPM